MAIRLRESYAVADQPIFLDVVSGEGQKPLISVDLDGSVLGEGQQFSRLALGDGAALRGKTLRVIGTVTVMNANSNHTIVTYTLTGGATDRTFVSSHEAASRGDTVDYDAKFSLI